MSSRLSGKPVLDAPAHVLIVDDEEAFHRSVARYLDKYCLHRAFTGTRALETLSSHTIDVVLLDLGLPDRTGIELLADIKVLSPNTQIIVVTASAELRLAVETVKAGAFDFLAKQHENYRALSYHIQRALENRRWKREAITSSASKDWHSEAFRLLEMSTSQAVRDVTLLVRSIAATPLSILIEGPSGSGKEIVASYVHAHSGRATAPFVPVNVGAVPETLIESLLFGHVKGAFTGAEFDRVGKFEAAKNGTIFLDEIGDLSPSCQVKLLRVLQEHEIEPVGARGTRPIECRIVAATNKNLYAEVQAGRFREDLYYRLNGIRVELPPLSARTGDIPALVRLLAAKSAQVIGCAAPHIAPEVLQLLTAYAWPGNIRELENLVMRLVATCVEGRVTADAVPQEYCLPTLMKSASNSASIQAAETRPYFLAREQFERYLVRHAVDRCHGNKRRAAQELGVSYSTVKEKIRKS